MTTIIILLWCVPVLIIVRLILQIMGVWRIPYRNPRGGKRA
jgi:hypothetical protein